MQKELIDAFVASFGRDIVNSPVIFPAFNNYYQDIAAGGSKLGNLTKVNGVTMFPPGENPSYPDFSFKWHIDGVLVSEIQNPTLADLKPEEGGVVKIRIVVEHLPTTTIAIREEWAFLGYNDLPLADNEGAPSQWNVFVPFFPDVDPVEEYMSLRYDYNGNGIVDAQDLLTHLGKPQ